MENYAEKMYNALNRLRIDTGFMKDRGCYI